MDDVELEPVDHTPDFEPATFDQRFNAAPATFDQRFPGPQGTPVVPGDKVWNPGGPEIQIAGDVVTGPSSWGAQPHPTQQDKDRFYIHQIWGPGANQPQSPAPVIPIGPTKTGEGPVAHSSVADLLSNLNPVSSAHAEESNPISAAIMQHPVLTPNAPGPGLVAGPLGAAPGAAPLPGSIPQRLPTSTRNPLDGGGNVDMASMKADPKLFQKNTDLLRNYPNMTGEESKLSSDDLADAFVAHVKNNLLWLHDQVPDDIRQRSSLWYDGGNKIVKNWAQQYGLPEQSVAGVIAAQSPQKDWYQNVSLAGRVLNIYHGPQASQPMTPEQEGWFKGSTLDKPEYQPMFDSISGKSLEDIRAMDLPADEKSVLQAMWIRSHDEAHGDRSHNEITPEGNLGPVVTKADGTPSGTGWGSLGEIAKGVRSIESGGDPDVLSRTMGERHKVRNFYNNLLNPNSPSGDVTIDTHAVAAGLLRPLSGNSLEVSHNFNNYAGKGQPGAGGSAITGVQGTYPLYAEAYRQAAAERGILPRQMQSITWEAARGLFPDTFKTAKNNNLINTQWLLYRSGKQSLDETRSNILNAAGGINPPSWYRPAGQADAAIRNPTNGGELSQPELGGQAAPAAFRRGNTAGAQMSLPRVDPNAEQALGDAYQNGADAYLAGHPREANPEQDRFGVEWDRGYKFTQKRDRFNRTIAARQQ